MTAEDDVGVPSPQPLRATREAVHEGAVAVDVVREHLRRVVHVVLVAGMREAHAVDLERDRS